MPGWNLPPVFSLATLRKFPEVIPLCGFLTLACGMGVTMCIYSLSQKPDVALNNRASTPPWERVNPQQQQKFLKTNMEYRDIPELEKLRKEIGSYKY